MNIEGTSGRTLSPAPIASYAKDQRILQWLDHIMRRNHRPSEQKHRKGKGLGVDRGRGGCTW